MSSTLETALAYLRAGLGVLPIRTDGSKAPALPKGHPFLRQLPTEANLQRWFDGKEPHGIAIPGGKVSGNLECLDFETVEIYRAWAELIDLQLPGLVNRLSVCKTPGHYGQRGIHVRYRCPGLEIPGSMGLAWEPAVDAAGVPAKDGRGAPVAKLLIETRGEGGYAVAPGSPAVCHPTGRLWEHVAGPELTNLPNLTALEREILIQAARSLNSWVEPDERKTPRVATGVGGRLLPGADYNQRGPDWGDLLGPHGWRVMCQRGGVRYWKRPDKLAAGCSATTGFCKGEDGVDLLHVFSSNALPLKPGSYCKFRAYAILTHRGDFKAAAKQLATEGYGEPYRPAQNGQQRVDRAESEQEPWGEPIPLSELPPAEPFPLEVFPAGLRQFAEEVAWATNSPVDFAAAAMLAIAGGAIGNSQRLAITRKHTQGASLFVAIIGRPGTRKTPVLDIVREPLEEIEAEYRQQYIRERTAWEEGGEKSPRPVLRRLVLDDFTTERLNGILEENPRGVVVIKDELVALVQALNQYKGAKGADRQIILQLWSGSAIRVDRKSNGGLPVYIRRPFCCIVGAIQPDVVEKLRGEAERQGVPIQDGFIDRFLPVYPDHPAAVAEQWRDVAEETEIGWRRIVCELASWQMLTSENHDGHRPRLLRLDSTGRDAWARFTQAQADELNSGELPEFLRGCWEKLTGYCGRLALILHCLRVADGEDIVEVDGQSVNAAAQVVAYFKCHIKRLSVAMDLNPIVVNCKRALEWASRKEVAEFRPRDLMMDLSSSTRFRSIEETVAILNYLARYEYLRQKGQNPRGRPGSVSYEINPNWDRKI